MNKERHVLKDNRFYNGVNAFKVIDFAAQIALIFLGITIISCVTGEVMVDRKEYIGPFIMHGFIIFILIKLYGFFKQNKSAAAEVKFEGDIDQLTIKMVADCGLHLKRHIKNYYIFGSHNKIMPNVEYMVRDCGEHCIVVSPKGQFHNIDRVLQSQLSEKQV